MVHATNCHQCLISDNNNDWMCQIYLCSDTLLYERTNVWYSVWWSLSVYFNCLWFNAPIQERAKHLGYENISCGFWFLFLNFIALVINAVFKSVIGILYKNRKREDVLPNEQIFAERFYTKQLGL